MSHSSTFNVKLASQVSSSGTAISAEAPLLDIIVRNLVNESIPDPEMLSRQFEEQLQTKRDEERKHERDLLLATERYADEANSALMDKDVDDANSKKEEFRIARNLASLSRRHRAKVRSDTVKKTPIRKKLKKKEKKKKSKRSPQPNVPKTPTDEEKKVLSEEKNARETNRYFESFERELHAYFGNNRASINPPCPCGYEVLLGEKHLCNCIYYRDEELWLEKLIEIIEFNNMLARGQSK
ncbi:hypothetical protein PCE1_000269 [Barthelona sp. PCE]